MRTRADMTPTFSVRFLRGTLVNGKHVPKGTVLKVDFGAFDYFVGCGAAVEHTEEPQVEVVKSAESQATKAKAKTK